MSKTLALLFILFSTSLVGQSPYYRSPSESDADTRGCVRRVFNSQVGVTEATGNNDGEVAKYLHAVGFTEGYAWCGAFIFWVLNECDAANQFSNPRSFAWTPNFLQLDTKDPESYQAQTGDLILLYYPRLQRVGHVGFVEHWTEGHMAVTVEGNTNEAGVREGDGVRVKYRLKKQIHKVVNIL